MKTTYTCRQAEHMQASRAHAGKPSTCRQAELPKKALLQRVMETVLDRSEYGELIGLEPVRPIGSVPISGRAVCLDAPQPKVVVKPGDVKHFLS